ncbi:MAG: DUF998 domain-containing protein [Candidatus Aminicenantes bacterium]|nr:DUF998 domain-containing protein [Candidatus Aminicenantes bacterium]
MAAVNGKKNIIKWMTILAGLAASLFFCILTIIAIQHFPGTFSANQHYLSVLGNVNRNPNGAMFYNLGVMITGLSLLLFYIGFVIWNAMRDRSKILFAVLIFGSMNGFSIFMSAVYAEVPHYQVHFTWSLLIFIAFIPVLILFSIYLRRYSGLNRIISYSGFILAAYNSVFVIYALTEGTTSGSLLEWISVFSYIGWIMLHVINLMLFNKIQNKFS